MEAASLTMAQQQTHQVVSSGVKRRMVCKKQTELPEVPQDIVHNEILPRMPATSLVRFRLVCKSWNSLFSDPKFVKSQLNGQHSSEDQDLLICKKVKHDRGIFIISPSNVFHIDAVPLLSDILLGSINGLVCMASRNEFCLWNPAIGQLKEIYLPYEHAKNSRRLIGFIWDHARNDYKVVIVCYVSKRSSRQLSIYSSNSDSWTKRDIPNALLPDISIFGKSSIKVPSTIVKGLSYWSYSNYFQKDGTELKYTYISACKFVAEDNELRELPSFAVVGEKEFNLVNIKDCLVGMAYKRGRPDSLINIYSLDKESHCGVWSKICIIGPISSLHTADWHLSQCFKNGNKVLIVRPGPLSYYDFTTKETKFVDSTPCIFKWCFNYTPSLVCVQGMLSMQEFSENAVEEVKRTRVRSYQ